MAVTNVWNVTQMDCYPENQGESDVVFTVHYNLTGTDVQNETTYTGYIYGTVGVTYHSGEPYTPYADLTLDQVVGWVKDALGEEGVASAEANVAKQIENEYIEIASW